MNVQEDSDMTADTMVLAYSNPDVITVTVSVDQSDIAKLSIGDNASVIISEYGNFESKITEINPTTSSTSKSSVTYSVVVTLEGEVSELEANLTAQVMFATDTEAADTEAADTEAADSEAGGSN